MQGLTRNEQTAERHLPVLTPAVSEGCCIDRSPGCLSGGCLPGAAVFESWVLAAAGLAGGLQGVVWRAALANCGVLGAQPAQVSSMPMLS